MPEPASNMMMNGMIYTVNNLRTIELASPRPLGFFPLNINKI